MKIPITSIKIIPLLNLYENAIILLIIDTIIIDAIIEILVDWNTCPIRIEIKMIVREKIPTKILIYVIFKISLNEFNDINPKNFPTK